MRKPSYILIAAALILTGTVSCQKNTAIQPEGNVFTYTVSTKADVPAEGISNYSVYVIRQRDSVIIANKTVAPQEAIFSVVDTFKDLPFENCLIAAVANGNVIEEFTDSLEILHLTKGDKIGSDALDRIVICDCDSIASRQYMPLTGIAYLDITRSKNCNLSLEKMIARLNVTVHNNSSNTRLVVDTLYFSEFRGDRQFLFPHGESTPSTTTYTSLKGQPCADTIAFNAASDPMSWNLFESFGRQYSLNLKVTVPETETSVTITDIPILVSDKVEQGVSSELGGIARNDNVNVNVNVYYDSEGNIFKFNVGGWETETINKNID